jgi:spermidine synthase
MIAHFTELAWEQTALGPLTLRRRIDPVVQVDVFEVKLGEEFLMSSLFTVAEIELARLGLAAVDGDQLEVLVGGLGLGYTAQAALADPRVRAVTVLELLDPVIAWHREGLLPVSGDLTSDARTSLVQADFFAVMRDEPARRWDAILLDIDHSPRHLLDGQNRGFYTPTGIAAAARHLSPGGVLAVWSDDPPDETFIASLESVFDTVGAEVVAFDNALTGGSSANTVYVARGGRAQP